MERRFRPRFFDTLKRAANTFEMPTTKGFRLDQELRESFERFCRDHLLDERAVVEAWLLRFLEAGDQERHAAAKRYSEWAASRKASSVITGKKRKAEKP